MVYAMPIQREKAVSRLAGMLRNDGPLIARQLAPRMAKVLEEGEEMPDLAHLLDVLGRMLKAEIKNLYSADDRRSNEGREQSWLRRQLNEVVPVLRARVVEVRDWLRHNYGAAKAKWLVGFEGRTPRGSEELADLARVLVRRLPALKPKQGPGGDVDPARWSDYLTPPLEKTSELLEQMELRRDGVEIAVEAKSRVLLTFDKTFRRVRRIGELFYLLAGFERTAKHLRYDGGRPSEKIKKYSSAGAA